MTTERERVEELARTNALGLVGDDDAVWGQCLSSIGQAAHTKLSRTLGIGAPNNVDTTVAKAREVARLPRPKREKAAPGGLVVGQSEVLRAMRSLGTAARKSTVLAEVGSICKAVIDVRSFDEALSTMRARGLVVLEGRRYRLSDAAATNVAPPSGPSVLEADEEGGAA